MFEAAATVSLSVLRAWNIRSSPDGEPSSSAALWIFAQKMLGSIVTMMPTGSDNDLTVFRRWRRLRNWLTWLFVPGVFLISDVLRWLTRSKYTFAVGCAFWMVGLAYVVYRVQRWPCPNCGKPVMKKGAFRNDFTSRCLHCGFSLKRRQIVE